MKLSKLLTYSFRKNVGSKDRLFRIISGLIVMLIPTIFRLSQPISFTFWLAGMAWFATGVVCRCGLYYIFGFSTHNKKI